MSDIRLPEPGDGATEDEGVAHQPDVPNLPEVPPIDGPFIEVAPHVWVRGAAILAVEDYIDHVWQKLREAGHDTSRREYVATVTTAASQSGDLARWRSVYPLEQLRTACRLAEHREDLRRLALRAQLHVSTRRTGDGP